MVSGHELLNRVVDILSDAPSPDTILEINLTDSEQERFDLLAERNAEGKLSKSEEEELSTFLFADHFVGMAKAKAFSKLNKRTVA